MAQGIFRPPPQPFIGGRQPDAPRKLPPAITAVRVDNPPFDQLQTGTYATLVSRWAQYKPFPAQIQQQRDFVIADEIVPAPDDQPFTSVLQHWQPTPLPLQIRRLYAPIADAVAATADQPYTRDLSPILSYWRAKQATPQQTRPNYIESVDNPPAFSRASLFRILRQSDKVQPQPQRAITTWIESVDNPPFSQPVAPQALRNWKAPPTPAQRRSVFISEAIIVTADNPPFGSRDPFPNILKSWESPTPLRRDFHKVVIAEISAVVNNPPFHSRDHLSGILRTWDFYRQSAAHQNYPRIIQPGAVVIVVPPFIPPIIVPPVPTARPFESTHLEHSSAYGAVEMGSGPFGGTNWIQAAATAGGLVSTHLESSKDYGALEMGSGPFGGTTWLEATATAGGFQSTHLETSKSYGAVEMGSGPFGGTNWTRS